MSGQVLSPADLPDPQQDGQATEGATLVTAKTSTGPAEFGIPNAEGAGKIMVKFNCFGTGEARLTDNAGRLFLGTAGCKPNAKAIYTSEGKATSAHATLHLAVDANTAWRIAIWTVSA
jgi:hypothetical protein